MLTCWYPEQYGELMQENLPDIPATPRTPRTGPPREISTPTPSPAPPKPAPTTPEAAAAAAAASAVAAPDKWWHDSDEPLYLVVTADAVVVGRPCDADDQVLYLLRLENYAAAMLVATDAPYVRPETMEECRSAYLKHLLDTGDAAGALRCHCAVRLMRVNMHVPSTVLCYRLHVLLVCCQLFVVMIESGWIAATTSPVYVFLL